MMDGNSGVSQRTSAPRRPSGPFSADTTPMAP